MIDQNAYARARSAFLASGEVEPRLLDVLRVAVSRLIRFGGLPPIYSPTGRWDREAEDEVLSDWIAYRLLGKGQLAALLHQAATPASFSRLGELYLRRHLINRLAPNQASNLYARIREMLETSDEFESTAKNGFWRIVDTSSLAFDGPESELVRAAWRLGDFKTIQFREDAKKLSHLLDAPELHRFIHGLLKESGYALTLRQIMRATVLRFDLEPVAFEPLGDFEELLPAAPMPAVEVVSANIAARAALAELTSRQSAVLARQLAGATVREIAADLSVSIGTVSSEQRVIANVLGRISESQGASRGPLLNALRDLLFSREGEL